MTITFITTNKHKFEEAKQVLADFGIEIKQLDMEYEENHDADLEEIACGAARKLAAELNFPIVLEDTGLYFNAYPKFPGALPKFVFNSLGYQGIFKLLKGEDRGAYFKTVAAYGEPGKEPVSFAGTMRGRITEQIFHENVDAMPYDRIFIPDGEETTISGMTLDQKNALSQRGKVFRKLGEYLSDK